MPDSSDTANISPSPIETAHSEIGVNDLNEHIIYLQQQEQVLRQEITSLQASYEQLLNQQTEKAQNILGQLVQAGLKDLLQQRQALQIEVEQLERRRNRAQAEMRTNFAGVSQDLAVRVQGFKDYLVGSLQDLATAAEQLELAPSEPSPQPLQGLSHNQTQQRQSRQPHHQNLFQQSIGSMGSIDDQSSSFSSNFSSKDSQRPRSSTEDSPFSQQTATPPSFLSSRAFEQEEKQIRQILDQYRLSPDYYGMPWQLRRTFEPIHAERVSQWFFNYGGRGSLKSMGSRLQNILVASAIISMLRMIQGDRIRTLILSDSPGRLGEWRRGLQECLGISRSDFGAQQGVALFEAPEAVTQRADRLVSDGNIPLILIDHSENKVHLSLLQYPLWLAFAPIVNEIPFYY